MEIDIVYQSLVLPPSDPSNPCILALLLRKMDLRDKYLNPRVLRVVMILLQIRADGVTKYISSVSLLFFILRIKSEIFVEFCFHFPPQRSKTKPDFQR